MKLDVVLLILPHDVRGIGEEVLEVMAYGKRIFSWNDQLQLVVYENSIPDTNIGERLKFVLYPESEMQRNRMDSMYFFSV